MQGLYGCISVLILHRSIQSRIELIFYIHLYRGGFCIAAINKIYCNLRTLHYNFPIIEIAILKYDMPKFMTWIPTVVVSEDCLGSATALNGVEVNYNREIYHIEDSTLFMDEEHPENGMVPYEGQENANFLYVGKWYENGELQTLVLCEHIPM